ncbi:MAG: SurA N-terminal domain-containing protein [Cellvibrionaceae bacterium]
MLQAFRDNLKGTMAIFIVGLMIIPFALFGVDSLFLQDNSAGKAAEVNGEAISEMALTRAIRTQKQQLLERFGDQAPADLLSDEQLRGPVLTRLLQRELLKQAAQNGGMAISDASLDELIKSTPQFQQDGRFSPDLYLQLLRNMGYTPVTYKKLLTEDLLVNQHAAGLNNSAFATQGDIDTLTALTQQTRSFYYITLPYALAEDAAAVSEEEISQYYADNESSFFTQEQVSLDYLELSLEQLAANADVDPQEVRQQYQQESAAFIAAIQRHAAHILIEFGDEADDKLQQVRNRLAAGEDFAEVARELSDDLGSNELGGDLGTTDGSTFPESFESALASLEVGEVSEPIETDSGTHIIKLIGQEETQPPSFEESKARIAENLASAAAETVFVELLEALPEATYNASTLEEAAQELGMEVSTSELFSRTGGQGIFANNQVLAAAFSDSVVSEGLSSDVIELSDNHVVVVKLNQHKPVETKALDVVSDEIKTLITQQKVTAALTEKADALVADIKDGKSVSSVAEDSSLEWQVAANVTRSAPDVEPELLRAVFDLPKPQNEKGVTTIKALSSGDVVVAQLTVVQAGQLPTMEEAQKKALQQRLASELAGGEMGIYQSSLNDDASVDIY